MVSPFLAPYIRIWLFLD